MRRRLRWSAPGSGSRRFLRGGAGSRRSGGGPSRTGSASGGGGKRAAQKPLGYDVPHTWTRALDAYRYPVDLREFSGAPDHAGWFDLNIDRGDPIQTMAFETRFRRQARRRLEPWAEVVFWKLYTMPPARNNTTRAVLAHDVAVAEVWSLCMEYVENPRRQSFSAFRAKLFDTPRVATAATFPAFLCPESFPMVDTQITRWAWDNGASHDYSAVGGPALACIPDLQGEQVMESHWPFVESWIRWCRFTARRLTELTGRAWRARDVEMAVFTAQRAKREGRDMPLTPLAKTCTDG